AILLSFCFGLRTALMPQSLVVFVHGFGSSSRCWKPFLDLLQRDTTLREKFDFVCYEYETPWLRFNPLKRIPRLREIGSGLGNFLSLSRFSQYKECVLIGHSLGGLVIQSYISESITEREGTDLERITSVVLFATPNRGSETLAGPRRFLSSF